MRRLLYVNIMYILVGKSGKQSIICIGIIPNLIGVLRILRAIRIRIIDVNVVPYIGQCMRVRYLSHTHKNPCRCVRWGYMSNVCSGPLLTSILRVCEQRQFQRVCACACADSLELSFLVDAINALGHTRTFGPAHSTV